ncbi:MAG: Type secretory pathway, component PulF [Chthonomonadaceae bacterium]|nr:Type secretory pathway, component PulF [Chthonomonadaceae bacterium]
MDYLYEAVDPSGRTVMGKIDANDEVEVRRKLTQMGYRPQTVAAAQNTTAAAVAPRQTGMGSVAVTPNLVRNGVQTGTQTAARGSSITLAGNAAKLGTRTTAQTQGRTSTALNSNFLLNPVNPNASKLGGVSTKDLAFYFQQLAPLVKSGMTIYTALDNLAARTPNKNLAQTAREMAEAARKGQRISDVMELYPRIYPDHIVGMVRAGEMGGFLEIALAEIALNFEQNIALYKGMWIPKLMASQAIYLLPIIVPLMPCIFASMDFAANMVLYLKWELVLLPLTALFHLLLIQSAKQARLPQYRRFRDSMSLQIPAFGNLQRVAALSAFVRMLRRLHHAGVAPIQAWECAMNTADNVIIREKLASSYTLMNQGASFSDAFAATGLFDNQIENLVITGQQSGEIVESLDKAADHYQERVFDATVRAKRVMWSMGLTTMLVLGGGAICWLTYSEYHSMFGWVDKNFSTDFLPLF